MMFPAILWIAGNGSAWRDLPECFDPWKTVYSRFCKWREDGTLQLVFKTLNADADYENLSIDSTLIKAHQHSAGVKKGQPITKTTSTLGKAGAETQPKSMPL